jgi:VWFA-related protein
MKRFVAACGVALLGVAAAAAQARLPPPGFPPSSPTTQVPQFRSRVDLVHLDVSVLDANRRPVRGLGPADFTVLENGVPQTIAAFTAIDIPDPEPPKATWMRDVAPDVRTNADLRERRLFLVIIDDAAIQANPFALKSTKEIARKVIDKFGPSDLAAIVFTRDNRNSQDFTSDRARWLAAIDKFTVGFRNMGGPDDLYLGYSVNVVESAVKVLTSMPDRRKAIIYIGQGVPVDLEAAAGFATPGIPEGGVSGLSNAGFMSRLAYQMSNAFRDASRANVNVYPVDVCGLRAPPAPPPPPPTCVPGLEVEYLNNLAGATGGRPVVNTNDFDPGVAAIFDENSSYYLLGYQSTDPRMDGKLRRLEVRVTRPGLNVRTRSGYVADRPNDAKRKAELEAAPLGAALAGVVPKSDLPMQLTAAPFAIAGKKEAAVAVMLGVKQPIRETGARTVEKVDLVVSAFDVEGRAFGSTRLRADVTIRADAKGLAEYEVLARIDLKPGRYQLRTAASVGSISTSGSLYFDVDVPDFGDAPVSLSGLLLAAAPAPIVAPRDAFKAFLPVVPTTKRAFGVGDQATAFVRVYQGGRKPLAAIPIRIRLKNDEDVLLMDRRDEVAPSVFNAARSADINVAIPVGRLPPGSYLLTMEATTAQTTASRQTRFVVTR